MGPCPRCHCSSTLPGSVCSPVCSCGLTAAPARAGKVVCWWFPVKSQQVSYRALMTCVRTIRLLCWRCSFGDWSEEEFVALMLPRRARLAARQQPDLSLANEAGDTEGEQAGLHKQRNHEVPHEPLVDPARVPAQLSWRGTGADGIGPKDQATCGEPARLAGQLQAVLRPSSIQASLAFPARPCIAQCSLSCMTCLPRLCCPTAAGSCWVSALSGLLWG